MLAGGGCGTAGGEGEFREALRDGFQLQEGRQHDVHVWVAARRLVDLRDRCGGEDGDGDGLRDCGFAVVLEMEVAGEGGWVGEFIVFVFGAGEGEVGGGGRECGVVGCGDGRGARGERVGGYG